MMKAHHLKPLAQRHLPRVLTFGVATLLGYSLLSQKAVAQININNTTTYTQNFNGLSQSNVAWSDNSTIAGWWAEINNGSSTDGTLTATTGAGSANGLLNLGHNGVNTVADRAIGSRATSGTVAGGTGESQNISYGPIFRNTSTTLALIVGNISYRGELYKTNSTADPGVSEVLHVFSRIGTTLDTALASGAGSDLPVAGANFSPLTDLNFTSVATPAAGATLDGNAAPNFTSFSLDTPGIVLLPNEYWTLKWTDSNRSSGTDGFAAIDDISVAFTAVQAPRNIVYNVAHSIGGLAPNGTLDTSTDNYWLGSGAVPTNYQENPLGDNITFSTNPTDGYALIDVPADISPAKVTVSHTTGEYEIGGLGKIGHGGTIKTRLEKSGTGVLRLNSPNEFTSVTTTGGTVVSADSNSVGGTLGEEIIDPGTGASSAVTSLTVNGTTTFEIQSVEAFSSFGGTGGIIKTGSETIKVLGVRSNTGATTINGGKLMITGASTGTGVATINSGTYEIRGANSSTAGITIAADGTFSAGIAAALGGNTQTITINGGILALDNRFTTQSDADQIVADTTATRTILVHNTLGATFDVSELNENSTSRGWVINRSNAITGSGPLIKEGLGILRFSQPQNLTQGWTVRDGAIETGITNGFGTGTITVESGGTVTIVGGTNITNPIVLEGGKISTRSADLTLGVPITVNQNSEIQTRSYSTPTDNRNITLAGIISGNAEFSIIGNDSNIAVGRTVTVNNPLNDFTGSWRVREAQILVDQRSTGTGSALNGQDIILNQGTIRIRDNGTGSNGTIVRTNALIVEDGNAFGAGVVDVDRASGGNTGHTVQFPSLKMRGLPVLEVKAGNGYKVSISGSTILEENSTFGGTGQLTLEGVVEGSYDVNKIGSGRLVLQANNTYTGTTLIRDGSVIVNGSISGTVTPGPDTPEVLVLGPTQDFPTGGTLAGSGSIGPVGGQVRVDDGGTLSPGDNGPGSMQILANLLLNAGAKFNANVGDNGPGPQPGTSYDQVNVGNGFGVNNAATVSIDGATLQLTVNPANLQSTDQFFLVINDGVEPVIGTFANDFVDPLDGLTKITGGGIAFNIYYDANSVTGETSGGNDILIVVPEPTSALLGLLGIGVLATRRRRVAKK